MNFEMIRKIIFILLAISLSEALVSREMSKIKLVYGAERTMLPVAASCTEESFSFNFGKLINFLTTYDMLFLYEFEKLFEDIKPLQSDSVRFIDPRIMAIITYKDSIPNDTICFGEFHGICLNGVLMQDDKKMLNLVKKKIGWKYEENE